MTDLRAGVLVTPTAEEVRAAEDYVARIWHRIAPAFIPYGTHDHRQTVVRGYLAEHVVARVLGVEIPEYKGPDGGVDLLWHGLTVQVKWNHYSYGDLYSRPDLSITADLFVLVVPCRPDPQMRIVGYLTRDEYLQLRQPRSYGRGNTVLAVGQQRLHPIQRLLVSPHG
jgi:hypothetical protein